MRIKSFLTMSLTAILLASCGATHNENQLRKQFVGSIDTLTQLEVMLREDRVFSVIQLTRYEQFPKENGIIKRNVGMSEQRWDEYRHLFYKAGLEYGVQYYGPKQERSVRFDVKEGMGYVYSEAPFAQTVKSFDECSLAKRRGGICYVLIQKNWYLYLFNN